MTVAARAYARLTDETDPEAITCEDLPPEACRAVPRSFLANAANGASTKLAEQIASPGLVLALLLGAMGAPVALVGLLEPVRRGFALAPQLAVSGRIRAVELRKRFWVAAGATQAFTLVLMAIAATSLRGIEGGGAVVAALVAFSVASGVGSVAFSDVIAKTVPKGKRGQLLGIRAAAGGGATIIAGVYLRARLVGTSDTTVFVWLLLAAAGLWALAAFLFSLVPEQPGATEGASNPLQELRHGIREVIVVPGFRRYLVARALLLSVELAIPFYALYGRSVAGGAGALGAFLIATGIGQLAGSPLWGKISDHRSSRTVLIVAGGIGALASAVALGLGQLTGGTDAFAFASVFLLASLAQAGVRLGRKAFIADGAPKNQRSFYTATANTAAGVITLTFAILGVIAQVIGLAEIIIVILALSVGGVLAAWRMPEAHRLTSHPGH